MCLILSIQQGISSIHLARSPERAKVYASAEIRKMVYANTPEVVEALKGIDVLLMVSARENPERVEEHKSFFRCRKACWSAVYRLYLLLRSR